MTARVSRDEALAAAARVAAAAAGRTVWIGVDGFGASGKSSFAADLAQAVPDAVVVAIDDFAGPAIPEWDWARFRAQVLAPLLAGRPARYQRWDWASDSGAEWHEVPVGRPVVVEGVSVTRREVGAPWALTVWLDASREVRLARALERDGLERMPRWLTDWMPSEDAWAERDRPTENVDLIVCTDRQEG